MAIFDHFWPFWPKRRKDRKKTPALGPKITHVFTQNAKKVSFWTKCDLKNHFPVPAFENMKKWRFLRKRAATWAFVDPSCGVQNRQKTLKFHHVGRPYLWAFDLKTSRKKWEKVRKVKKREKRRKKRKILALPYAINRVFDEKCPFLPPKKGDFWLRFWTPLEEATF